MAKRPTKSLTVKLPADLVDRLRHFVRCQRGQPLFLTVNALSQAALERELERLALVLAGALPMDRTTGRDDEPDDPPPAPPTPRRRINTSVH